ncbi:GFA family protein [Arthrobacter sp. alpha11c]
MKLDGQCLCGEVTYTIDSEPKFTALCHCTDCQRQTGGAYSLVIGVDDEKLKITGEAVKTFITVGSEHETNTNRSFCGECGSPIVGRIDAMPGLAFVKAGTLNDTSWLKPTVEVWCRSAQPWVEALPGAERYDGDIPA